MTSAHEAREALNVVADAAVTSSTSLLAQVSGTPGARRAALLEGVTEIVGTHAEGAAALAADFYEDAREGAGASTPYAAQLDLPDRTERLRRGIAWAADPLFADDEALAAARLAQVVQPEVARPFRETILANRRSDPDAVGWRRVSSGSGCNFCRMLAARGAVYKTETARFASHPHCHCAAEPVFLGGTTGPEASVMQYRASLKNRTPAQRAELRAYLDSMPDVPVSLSPAATAVRVIDSAKTTAEVGEALSSALAQKGITVRGFDAARMNLEAVKDSARTIHDLVEKYPKNGLKLVEIVDYKNDTSVARASNLGTRRIEIRQSALRNAKATAAKLAKDEGFAISSDYSGVLTHEFGHVLDLETGMSVSNSVRTRVEVLAKSEGATSTSDVLRWKKAQTSTYGFRSDPELVAEAFADVELNGYETASTLHQSIYNQLLLVSGNRRPART